MAQSKKRVTPRKRKSTVRKSSKSLRGKAERTATKLRSKKAVAKTKRPKAEKVARKTARPLKPLITPVAETKPAPGVITITEFEETDIREAGAGEEPPEES